MRDFGGDRNRGVEVEDVSLEENLVGVNFLLIDCLFVLVDLRVVNSDLDSVI